MSDVRTTAIEGKKPSFSIVGMGSAGRKHYAAIRRLFPDALIIGVSASRPVLDGIDYVADCATAVARRPDYAIIASPAPSHLNHALPFVEAGIPTLIEKPMGMSGDEIENFSGADANCEIRVGYVLRQSRCLVAVKRAIDAGAIGSVVHARIAVGMHLADWRTGTNAREGISANALSGGGALMELSHEIDLARWFFGDCASLYARIARLGDLTVDVEDFVEIVATFANGVEASIHLDMLARPAFRIGLISGTAGQIRYDLTARPARAEISDGHAWRPLAEDTAPLAELFERQIDVFVSAEGRRAMANAQDGRAIAGFIAAARRSAIERRSVETKDAA